MLIRLFLPIAAVLAAVGALIPAGASAKRSCAGAGAVPTSSTLDRTRSATLCLLNRERASRGLPRLKADRRLHRAAAGHSRAMVRHRFFAHDSAVDGSTAEDRVRAAGFLRGASGWRVGENIAWGSGSSATPRRTVRAWMRSPGHRANILSRRFREIGVGIATGAPRTGAGRAATYTTSFGTRG